MEIGLEAAPKTSKTQLFGRLLLGLMLFNSGVSHLTYLRQPFQAQVPPWVPLNPDLVVVLSGCVEIILGLSLMALFRRKAYVGIIAALFFVAVFLETSLNILNTARHLGWRRTWLASSDSSFSLFWSLGRFGVPVRGLPFDSPRSDTNDGSKEQYRRPYIFIFFLGEAKIR